MWFYCLRTSRVIPIYIFILFTIQSGRVNVIKIYLISFTLYTVSTQITTINFDDLYAVFGEGAFYCLYSLVDDRMDYFSTSTFHGLYPTSFALTVIPLHFLYLPDQKSLMIQFQCKVKVFSVKVKMGTLREFNTLWSLKSQNTPKAKINKSFSQNMSFVCMGTGNNFKNFKIRSICFKAFSWFCSLCLSLPPRPPLVKYIKSIFYLHIVPHMIQ